MSNRTAGHFSCPTIEKDIEIPSRNVDAKYPFKDMEVGDSFFTISTPQSYVSLHTRVLRPKKFSCRTVVENGIRGLRIWRIQ
jgi:hypothetical protein